MYEQQWSSPQHLPGRLVLALLMHGSRLLVSAQGVPYNCTSGFESWSVEWSNTKKDYCCRHEKRGCRYDCQAAFQNWRGAWSEEKKQWCCRFEQLGCGARKPTTHTWTTTTKAKPTDQAEGWPLITRPASALGWVKPFGFHEDVPTYTSTSSKSTPRTTLSTHTTTLTSTTTTTSFDCMEGLSYFHKTWSPEKSEVCCTQHGKGCRIDPCTVGLRSMRSAWSSNKTEECCGRWVEQGRWPPFTKTHCCRTKGIGCLTSPATSTTAKARPTSFDCHAGYEHWEAEWSLDKKAFCCLHTARGCSEKQTTTTTMLQMDCRAGVKHWRDGWSKFKQDYCCKAQGFPCRHDIQNKSTAKEEQSPGNDTHAEGMGSNLTGGKDDVKKTTEAEEEEDPSKTVEKTVGEILDADKEGGHRRDKAAEIIVSDNAPYECSLEHFDCTAGIKSWRTTWSVAKREWCCTHDRVWCPTHGGQTLRTEVRHYAHWSKSSAVSTRTWSKSKRDWCCKHKNTGCSDSDSSEEYKEKPRLLERALEVVGVKADTQQAQLVGSINNTRMCSAALLVLAAAGVALSVGLAGRARVSALTRRNVVLLPTGEEANE